MGYYGEYPRGLRSPLLFVFNYAIIAKSVKKQNRKLEKRDKSFMFRNKNLSILQHLRQVQYKKKAKKPHIRIERKKGYYSSIISGIA